MLFVGVGKVLDAVIGRSQREDLVAEGQNAVVALLPWFGDLDWCQGAQAVRAGAPNKAVREESKGL